MLDITTIRRTLIALAVLAWAAAACDDTGADADAGPDAAGDADTDADGDADTDADGDTDTSDDVVTATVAVPEGFDETPLELDVFYLLGLTESPVGTGLSLPAPAIAPGEPLEIEAHHAGLSGEYYVAVVLYVEGGGFGGFPETGIDYVYISEAPEPLGDGPVELGDIELDLY